MPSALTLLEWGSVSPFVQGLKCVRLPPSPAHSSGCLPAEPGRCGRHSCGGRRNCQMRRSVFWEEEQEEEEAKKSPLSSVITHSLLSLVASRPTFTTTTTSGAVPPCLPASLSSVWGSSVHFSQTPSTIVESHCAAALREH